MSKGAFTGARLHDYDYATTKFGLESSAFLSQHGSGFVNTAAVGRGYFHRDSSIACHPAAKKAQGKSTMERSSNTSEEATVWRIPYSVERIGYLYGKILRVPSDDARTVY